MPLVALGGYFVGLRSTLVASQLDCWLWLDLYHQLSTFAVFCLVDWTSSLQLGHSRVQPCLIAEACGNIVANEWMGIIFYEKSVMPLKSVESWVPALPGHFLLAVLGCVFTCPIADRAMGFGGWNLGFVTHRRRPSYCCSWTCSAQARNLLIYVQPKISTSCQGLLAIAIASTVMPVLPLVLVPANSRLLAWMKQKALLARTKRDEERWLISRWNLHAEGSTVSLE